MRTTLIGLAAVLALSLGADAAGAQVRYGRGYN
jgi:hypothetical protein